MSASNTYQGVTDQIFNCVKTKTKSDYGTVYKPETGNTGTATTDYMGTHTELEYDLNTDKKTLTYSIKDKSWVISEDRIWSNIEDTLKGCGWKG